MVVTQELVDLLSQNIGVKIITEIDNEELAYDYTTTVNDSRISFTKTRMTEYKDRWIVECWHDIEEVIAECLENELIWNDDLTPEKFDEMVKEKVNKLQWEDVIVIRAN